MGFAHLFQQRVYLNRHCDTVCEGMGALPNYFWRVYNREVDGLCPHTSSGYILGSMYFGFQTIIMTGIYTRRAGFYLHCTSCWDSQDLLVRI